VRPIIIAGAASVGLVALSVAISPLTAVPDTAPTPTTSPAMSRALAFCRSPNGLDQICVGALAKALVRDTGSESSIGVGARQCVPDPRAFANVDRRD